MKSVTRRCSTCRKKVSSEEAVIGSLRAFCSYPCLQSFTASQRGKQAVQLAKAKEVKERKEKLKTRSDYVKEAQAAFNRYVRIRDSNRGCISCGSMPEQKLGGTMDCGHYRSRGSAPHLKYDLRNTAGQCVKCNRYLSGAVTDFRIGLIKRWGSVRIEQLESDNSSRKFTEDYLKRIKAVFSKRANLYQRKFR